MFAKASITSVFHSVLCIIHRDCTAYMNDFSNHTCFRFTKWSDFDNNNKTKGQQSHIISDRLKGDHFWLGIVSNHLATTHNTLATTRDSNHAKAQIISQTKPIANDSNQNYCKTTML